MIAAQELETAIEKKPVDLVGPHTWAHTPFAASNTRWWDTRFAEILGAPETGKASTHDDDFYMPTSNWRQRPVPDVVRRSLRQMHASAVRSAT